MEVEDECMKGQGHSGGLGLEGGQGRSEPDLKGCGPAVNFRGFKFGREPPYGRADRWRYLYSRGFREN